MSHMDGCRTFPVHSIIPPVTRAKIERSRVFAVASLSNVLRSVRVANQEVLSLSQNSFCICIITVFNINIILPVFSLALPQRTFFLLSYHHVLSSY
jgi:hypothetical protein